MARRRRAGSTSGQLPNGAGPTGGEAPEGPIAPAPRGPLARALEAETAPAPTPPGEPNEPGHRKPLPDVVVCASGNLGLISFPNEPGRVTLDQIETLHPGLVDGLVRHPGIAFVLVRTDRGGVCIGRDGERVLAEGAGERTAESGADPVAPFGEHALAGLRRLDAMPNAPDLLAVSLYDPESDEVAAFEELIGSHGGLGGPQSRAFLLSPSDWPLGASPLVGAPAIYAQLRRWLEEHVGLRFGQNAPD